VLTQFNSSSLNSHIKNTYNFSIFSKGFVDILAAEQTNDGDKWFEVRQMPCGDRFKAG
jgi:glucose-1-phosphate adenylyltransferase